MSPAPHSGPCLRSPVFFFPRVLCPQGPLSFDSIVWESCLPVACAPPPRKGQAGLRAILQCTFRCLGQLGRFLSWGTPHSQCFADALSSAQAGLAEHPNGALGPKSFGTSQDQFAAS